MHVLVIDPSTCTLYETWDSTFTNPRWSCGSGRSSTSRQGSSARTGWSSADAAGLPILPGLVRSPRYKRARAEHAIRFTMIRTQHAYIHPATHAAETGTRRCHHGLAPALQGQLRHERLQAARRRSSSWRCKRYGLILADNGSDWYITGDNDDAWSPMMEQLAIDFRKVHGQRLRGRRVRRDIDGGPQRAAKIACSRRSLRNDESPLIPRATKVSACTTW